MLNDDIHSGPTARSRGSSARAKVIDQDGREVHSGPRDADPFGPGAFGRRFSASPFQQGPFAFDFGTAFRPLTREQRLARLDALAKLLDVAFIVPGTNVRYGIEG